MPSNKNINYIHFDTIDSTNAWVKKNASTLDSNCSYCITASEQTAGVGRFHRQWVSPKGENIYATLYFTLSKNFPFLANLGQLLSLSCAKILKAKGFQPEIKWPNDLLLAKKKVAGILCEVIPVNDDWGIVLGIGINVNMSKELLETIDQPATSLAQISGRSWDFQQILPPLIDQFFREFAILQQEGFAPFVNEYLHFLAFKGEQITCSQPPVTGILHSIDQEGRLQLLLPSGELMTIVS